jgi:hypothetical protein
MNDTNFNDDALDNAQEINIREDKVFNNSYYNGDNLKDSAEYEFSKKISISHDYSDAYLKDIYDYEEELESKFILDVIFEFIKKDSIISEYADRITSDPAVSKIKFSKEEINLIFNRVHDNLDITSYGIRFYSPIYILEVISSLSSLEYKKIFDLLDTDTQQLLVVELNKKYKFLDCKQHKKRIH